MKISSRTARIATAAFLVGAFVLGGGVSSTSARRVSKPSAPTSVAPRTKNGALPPVTTLMPKLPRTKNGAITTTVAPKKSTTTSMPRIRNGKPKSSTIPPKSNK
jgi:hypothetical protein